MGEVRIARRLLPEWGTLYATTQGLFFVPHAVDHAASTEAGALTGTSLMWTLGSIFWSPLVFLLPFIRETSPRENVVRVLRPRYLMDRDDADLPELLMEHPGAFFLPKQHVRSVSYKRGRCVIDRSQGSRLQLSPADSSRCFQENFIRLLNTPTWRIIKTT